MDARTWKIVGWMLAYDAPNADRVMAALAAGIEAHGAPAHAILDNGKDFRALDVAGGRRGNRGPAGRLLPVRRTEGMLGLLGITVHWAKPYNAKAKPIENWFRHALSDEFDRAWPTWCGRRPSERPESLRTLRADHAAGKYPHLTIETLRAELAKFIDGYELRTPGVRGACCGGRSVARAFIELRDPARPAVRVSAEELALLQTRGQRVAVGQNGVWVRHFMDHYWSDDAEFQRRRCASGRDTARHVVYRYRPGDPTRVWIFDARTDRFLCTAAPRGMAHPLAIDEADRADLAERIAAQNRMRRDDGRMVRDLRAKATNAVLALGRAADAAERIVDDPAAIPRPAAPVRLKLVARGEYARAADAAGRDRAAERDRRRAEARLAAELAATGTDDQKHAAQREAAVADPWELMAQMERRAATDGLSGETDAEHSSRTSRP